MESRAGHPGDLPVDYAVRSPIHHRGDPVSDLSRHREMLALLGVEDLASPLDDRSRRAPREVDPQIGVLPDVIAPDQGAGLRVDHGRAYVLDVILDEGLDELDRPA